MKNNQKGFGAIEGLLVLIVFLLIGFIGYYVLHTSKSVNTTYNAAANSSTSTQNAYSGWKSYGDDLASLKYPGTWAAVRDDNTNLPGTKLLELKGPDDKIVAQSTETDSTHKASLVLTIFQNSNSGQNTCSCKIYDVQELNISQLPNAKLAVASNDPSGPGGDSTKPAQQMAVTMDNDAKTGAETLNEDISIGSITYNISVAVANNDATSLRIYNVSQFESSQSVKDVIKILNSLYLK